MTNSAYTDQRVKKRLLSVLASWHRQFKDDPSMRLVSNLYPSVKAPVTSRRRLSNDPHQFGGIGGLPLGAEERESQEHKERERKQKGREEKEARKAKEREEVKRKAREKATAKDPQGRPNKQRKPFNFEIEKPNILSSIATASQASNNLINALKLVNREKESIEENTRVQETLTSAKAARKAVVRYIQVRLDNQPSGLITHLPGS
jgi:flagellar biosynthesis GTPase FlhF